MKFIIDKDKVVLDGYFDTNVSGTVNYYEIPIEYDETWNNLTIKAIITKQGEDEGDEVSVIGDKFFIDKEKSGIYNVGFVGYTIENNLKVYQVSTDLIQFVIDRGAGEITGTESHDLPTPSEWEVYIAQIQEMIDDIGSETDYNDLQNKPQINSVELIGNKSLHDLGIQPKGNYALESEIPTNTSDLNNDSGFITNTVNDLLNYYKKNETFTKQEVNDLISAITTLDLQVVQTLPTEDISTTTIYLVPKSIAETNNAYDEYIYISNNWEFIGSTEVDLTDYVKNTDYANDNIGGVIKTYGSANFMINANGNVYTPARTYAQYQNDGQSSFVGKGTLENVITGKNLETANNKVTSISSSSTDTQYPSAKAVYDYIDTMITSAIGGAY